MLVNYSIVTVIFAITFRYVFCLVFGTLGIV